MIFFHVDKLDNPPLPSSVAFQIPVSIQKEIVSRCIIDERISTCVMTASVLKQLGSPNLSLSTITLCSWDGHPSHPLGLYRNFLVTVASKATFIDIEVLDAPLNYNILLGHSYTHAMSIVSSTFHLKM